MHQKRGLGNGNSNARVLNQILAKNQVIDHLVLSDTGLDDVSGERVLCSPTRNEF
jgi:hypothetical protein